jgi:hypothetical protein
VGQLRNPRLFGGDFLFGRRPSGRAFRCNLFKVDFAFAFRSGESFKKGFPLQSLTQIFFELRSGRFSHVRLKELFASPLAGLFTS